MHVAVKRTFWTLMISVLVLVIGTAGIVVYLGTTKQGVPGPDAMKALEVVESNTAVEVTFDDWFVIRPTATEPKAGLIIYPGAHTDVRGYVQVMTKIVEAGYLAVAPKMPLGYAFLAPNKAEDVYKAYPEIKHWFLAGHSLGGAMAAQYVHSHGDKLVGLSFWDSYPPDYASLANSKVPAMLLYRATLDGEPEAKFNEKKHLFPAATEWIPIKGGDHGQFGSFKGGMFKEFGMFIRGMNEEEWEATQWKASISRDEQQAIIVRAMINWFEHTLDRTEVE